MRAEGLILAYSKVISDSEATTGSREARTNVKEYFSKHDEGAHEKSNINIVLPPPATMMTSLFYLYGNKTPSNARAELIKKKDFYVFFVLRFVCSPANK